VEELSVNEFSVNELFSYRYEGRERRRERRRDGGGREGERKGGRDHLFFHENIHIYI